jgi:pimeloyl-ACP methyl ester carboxylesterase
MRVAVTDSIDDDVRPPAYLLLHGGGLGAWSWDPLRRILEASGAPTMAPELALDEYGLVPLAEAAAAAGQVGTEDRLVVVGHALGCSLLPLVGARVPARLLVWVCGVVPVAGLSCADQIRLDPSMVPMYKSGGFEEASSGLSARQFADALFHDCDPGVRRWAESHMRLDRSRAPVNAATDPLPSDAWPEVPKACVLARDDRALSASWLRRAARRLGVEPIELDGGHCPNLSRPEQLAAALMSLVDSSQTSVD